MNSEWSNEDDFDRELRKEAGSFRIEASDALWERLDSSLAARKALLYEEEKKRRRRGGLILISLLSGLLGGALLTLLLLQMEQQDIVAPITGRSGETELNATQEPRIQPRVIKQTPQSAREQDAGESVEQPQPSLSRSVQGKALPADKQRPEKPVVSKGLNKEVKQSSAQGPFRAALNTSFHASTAGQRPQFPVLKAERPVTAFTLLLPADSLKLIPVNIVPLQAPVAVVQADSNMALPDSANMRRGGKKHPGNWAFTLAAGMAVQHHDREINDWTLEGPFGGNGYTLSGSKDEVKYVDAQSRTLGVGVSYRISDRWQLHAGLGVSQFSGREMHRFYTEHPDSFISGFKRSSSRPVTPKMDTVYTRFLAQKDYNSSSIQYSLYRFSVPLMLSAEWPVQPNLNLRLEAGCGIYYLLGGDTRIYDYTYNRFTGSQQNLRKLNTELRMACVLVYELPGEWQLQGGMNFSQMMQSIYKETYAGSFKPRQSGFVIGVAHSF